MDIRDLTHAGKAVPEGDVSFRNHLLVAMPGLRGEAFAKSVIYICAHSPAGAMGIVINQKLPEIRFSDMLEQLQLPHAASPADPVVHFGGPVETGRGFVLHTSDFMREGTVRVGSRVSVTSTVDILRAIAQGNGPQKSIFALGYAGWGPGQLDAEMHANLWLTIPADDDLVFSSDLAGKWERAMMKMGVNPAALSFEAGHA